MSKFEFKVEATYRVVAQNDNSFGVEVTIPDTFPTTVSSFATEAAADIWVEGHKARLLAPPPARSRFRR